MLINQTPRLEAILVSLWLIKIKKYLNKNEKQYIKYHIGK